MGGALRKTRIDHALLRRGALLLDTYLCIGFKWNVLAVARISETTLVMYSMDPFENFESILSYGVGPLSDILGDVHKQVRRVLTYL